MHASAVTAGHWVALPPSVKDEVEFQVRRNRARPHPTEVFLPTVEHWAVTQGSACAACLTSDLGSPGSIRAFEVSGG